MQPEIQWEEIKQHHKLTNIDKFFHNALELCVKMRTRVPPFIISIDEEHFVREVHDQKHVRDGPNPEKNPEMPVIYLRPIVYYNYQKTLLNRGLVVGSTIIPQKRGAPAASVSTKIQQFSAGT